MSVTARSHHDSRKDERNDGQTDALMAVRTDAGIDALAELREDAQIDLCRDARIDRCEDGPTDAGSDPRKDGRGAFVIVLVNRNKGGVTKTTSAANLGAMISHAYRRLTRLLLEEVRR